MRAGLSWSKRKFIIISAFIGLIMAFLGFLSGTGLLGSAGLGFAAVAPFVFEKAPGGEIH
jgi:Flp pilus assembly protein TadB